MCLDINFNMQLGIDFSKCLDINLDMQLGIYFSMCLDIKFDINFIKEVSIYIHN